MGHSARAAFLLAGLLSGALVWSAPAQTTFATIVGTVRDPSGATIPGATVEAVHLASNYRYTTQANELGNYALPQLRDGTYRLRATAAGFQEYIVEDLQVATREERRIDVVLRVDTVETRVEVRAGAALIETETARIGDSKSAAVLNSLPLNTRSLYSFLALSPGVLQAGGGQATRRFAGSRVNQSEQSIDGITVSNGFDGTQISPLVSYIESYEEVRVDMANNTAEVGSVGQVTIVSKSGTNQLHGAVFDYYSTPWFRARNPFAAQRGTGVRHQPGGTIGGPIVLPRLYNGRDRSFFFFSFETSRGSNILQLLNPTVPLPTWRQGIFSDVTPPLRDPLANNQPFPNNRIPEGRINAVSKKIQERFWPLPNFGDATRLVAQNYREQKSRPFDPETYYTTRLDHRFSDRSFIFGRWTWNRSYSRAFEGNLPTIGQRWQTRDTRALNVSFTRNVRPDLVVESRYGFAYNDNPRNGPLKGREVASFLGLVGLVDNLPDLNGLLDVQFQGLGITRITQTQWRHPGFKNFAQQWQQHLNWYRGRHSLRTGYILSRVVFQDSQAATALFGDVRFSNRFTGHPYADFLLGIPTTAARAAPPLFIDRLRWAHDLFITDDFKASRRLTLNLGLRYELHPSYSEASGYQSTFDIERGKIVIPDGASSRISSLLPRGYVEVIEARQAGLPGSRLIHTDRNNFAPRFGFAFRPRGNDTVVRGGLGIFYDVVPRAETGGGAPFVINEPSFTNPANNPVVILPRIFPPAGVGGPTTISIPTAIRPDLRTPYSLQYNFTVEHQRWNTGFRISFVGTNTRQGEWQYNINQPLPDTRAYIDKPRRFPNYPAVNYLTNGAGHQYHSLTLGAERRFLKGLSYQGSWVWARDIGDLDRGDSPENAYDRRRERGVWLDVPTDRVTGNLIWELPVGRGRRYLRSVGRALDLMLGGWELSGIYSYYSGQFLTPLWTGPDPTGTAFTSSRTPATVTIRPDQLRNGNLPSSQRSPGRWFDATALASPKAGSYGTAARGVIYGPPSTVLHAGLAKSLHLNERVGLRLELTATNIANHPNYSPPDSMNISEPAVVGVINDVGDSSNLDASGSRAFRLGVRIQW